MHVHFTKQFHALQGPIGNERSTCMNTGKPSQEQPVIYSKHEIERKKLQDLCYEEKSKVKVRILHETNTLICSNALDLHAYAWLQEKIQTYLGNKSFRDYCRRVESLYLQTKSNPFAIDACAEKMQWGRGPEQRSTSEFCELLN